MQIMEHVQTKNYGATRQRGPTVSFEEIERTARDLMAKGERPTVDGVRAALGRGSPNHIATCMHRFWKNQASISTGNPLALAHLPPELADAALAQWEKALLLAQQTAKHDDTEARAHLEQLRRETTQHARALELREKDWDLAARVRERALSDAREHVNVLMQELTSDRAELRSRQARIVDLESQLEAYRQQLSLLVSRAVARNRGLRAKKPAPRLLLGPTSKTRIRPGKRPQSKRPRRTRR
jgi:hypothetical protein